MTDYKKAKAYYRGWVGLWAEQKNVVWGPEQKQSGSGGEGEGWSENEIVWGGSCLFMWGHAEHVKWFNPTHGTHVNPNLRQCLIRKGKPNFNFCKYPFAPHDLRARIFLLSDNSSLGLHLSCLLLQVSCGEGNWHQWWLMSAIGAENWLRSDLYSTVTFASCKKTTLVG